MIVCGLGGTGILEITPALVLVKDIEGGSLK